MVSNCFQDDSFFISRSFPRVSPRDAQSSGDRQLEDDLDSLKLFNVPKLYRRPRKTDKTQLRQLVLYEPDVNTVPELTTWHRS